MPSRLAQGVDPVLDLAGVGEEDMGVLGGDEAAVGPLEQLEAEQGLGVAEHLGDRRLRDVEGARRRADRAVDVDGVEDLDVTKVHEAAALGMASG
jgi:hypothetical protein